MAHKIEQQQLAVDYKSSELHQNQSEQYASVNLRVEAHERQIKKCYKEIEVSYYKFYYDAVQEYANQARD